MFTERDLKFGSGIIAGKNLIQNPGSKLEQGTEYNFLVGVVVDVIANPYEYLNAKLDIDSSLTVGELLGRRKTSEKQELKNLGVVNYQKVDSMPMNSIIAHIVDNGQSVDGSRPVVCYPFFPPHLSLPIKPGEYVWILSTDIKGSGSSYFWMCRQVGPVQVDDVNYTNLERLVNTEELVKNFNSNQGAREISDELLNVSVANKRPGNTSDNVVSNIKDTFSNLFANSFAFRKEFTGEPVPRVAKDCGDLLLQGSNNSGLHLTTEKFTPIDDLQHGLSANIGIGIKTAHSPAIDLFVSRKNNDINGLLGADSEKTNTINVVRNSTAEDIYSFSENDKIADMRYKDSEVFHTELHDIKDDAIDIGARLYMSNRCDVDSVFKSNFDVLGSEFGPSITTYTSGHNRVIGNQTVRLASITGESFLDMTATGNVVMKSSIRDGGTEGQQYLSLRANGTTRLQAKSDLKGGRIELAVRDDEGSPNDPYVLYSELRPLLDSIVRDLSILNVIRSLATEDNNENPMYTALQGFGIGLEMLITNIKEAVGAISGPANENVRTIKIDPRTDGTPYTDALLKVGSDNQVGMRGTIASTKIFGE
jgi:hypothetical protein